MKRLLKNLPFLQPIKKDTFRSNGAIYRLASEIIV